MKNLLVALSLVLSSTAVFATPKDTNVVECAMGKQNVEQNLIILQKYSQQGDEGMDILRNEIELAVRDGQVYVLTVERLVEAGVDANVAALIISEIKASESSN